MKIDSGYSSWVEIHFGELQGSIVGPLLFNIFWCDLLLYVKEIDFANYTNDNTQYFTQAIVLNMLLIYLKMTQ